MPLRQKQPILGQTCDLASTPDGQRAPSSGPRHEQIDDVDWSPDDARVALMNANTDDLENDAVFAMASRIAQGTHAPVRHGDHRLETSRFGGGVMSRDSLLADHHLWSTVQLPLSKQLPLQPS